MVRASLHFEDQMSRKQATLIGFSAVALWALLALFTVGSAPVPPLQLNAICFAIGGAIGLVWVAATEGFGVLKRISWKVYAFGTVALFGYHPDDPGWSRAVHTSTLHNPAGRAGAWISDLLLYLFGLSAWWWVMLCAAIVWWGYRRLDGLRQGDRRPLAIALTGFFSQSPSVSPPDRNAFCSLGCARNNGSLVVKKGPPPAEQPYSSGFVQCNKGKSWYSYISNRGHFGLNWDKVECLRLEQVIQASSLWSVQHFKRSATTRHGCIHITRGHCDPSYLLTSPCGSYAADSLCLLHCGCPTIQDPDNTVHLFGKLFNRFDHRVRVFFYLFVSNVSKRVKLV